MNKIEEVLKKLDHRAFWNDVHPDVIQLAADIREALKGCSVMTWHPGTEVPSKPGKYLCDVDQYTDQWDYVRPERFQEMFYHGDEAGWQVLFGKVTRWTELPERSE